MRDSGFLYWLLFMTHYTSELSQSFCNLPTSVGAWMLCHAMSCCN